MERKSGLGFGFFNKSKSKLGSRKKNERSERQMAEMYDKLAIRGSIKHVWGDDSNVAAASKTHAPAHAGIMPLTNRAQTMPVSSQPFNQEISAKRPASPIYSITSAQESAPSLPVERPLVKPQTEIQDVTTEVELDPPLQSFYLANVPTIVQELQSSSDAPIAPALSKSPSARPISSASLSRVASPSLLSHKRSVDANDHSLPVVHKKFSFCPSTISLASQRSPSAVLKGPRRSSLTNSNYPYPHSRRSSVFSSSTPSLHFGANRSRELLPMPHSDDVSIAAEEEFDQPFGTIQISPTNSLHYSNSIISRMSSTIDSPAIKAEDKFLPGSIYTGALPDALRGLTSVDALPEQYDEDDESSSISGISEVNAGNSDSEFDTDLDDDDNAEQFQGFNGVPSMITTDISDKIRRDSVKRVSYTKLENGDYLVAHKRRSQHSRTSSSAQTSMNSWPDGAGAGISGEGIPGQVGTVQRSASTKSDESQWSIEREYISGGI